MRLIKIVKTSQMHVGVLQLTLPAYTASRRRRSLAQNQISTSAIRRTALIDNKQYMDKMNTADNEADLQWQSCTAWSQDLPIPSLGFPIYLQLHRLYSVEY